MSIKAVPSFSPPLKPHAEYVDNVVGNKDGQVSVEELEAYKKKHPDATMYEPLKAELFSVTGQASNNKTSANATAPVAVGKGAGVLGFRLGQAGATQKAGGAQAAQAPVTTAVKQSLPLDSLTKIGASAAGEVFQLDAGGLAAMEARARQVVHPQHGPGTELQLRLTNEQSLEMTLGLQGGQIAGATEQPFVLEKAEFKDGATQLAADGAYQPKGSSGGYSYSSTSQMKSWKLEEPGKFTVEYVPPRENPQAYRDKVRIRVFGATDAERKANLAVAMERMKAPDLIANADATQHERLARLSTLRMVAPEKAEELATRLTDVSIDELDHALAAAGVDKARAGAVGVKEVFAGHMAAVDPALGEQYASLGVKAVMAGIKEVDAAAMILTSDGLMSSLERYGRGLHKAGASLSSDEASGGAEFAFTRLITEKAMGASQSISSSFGAGKVQLISTDAPMKELLSRTDWHAYPNDSYGTTVSRVQAEGPNADEVAKKEYGKRTSKFSTRPVLKDLLDQVDGLKTPPGSYGAGKFAQNNEACFKNGVSAKAFTHAVVADEATRTQLIDALKTKGLDNVNGVPLDKFVVVARDWKQVGQQLGMVQG